MSFKTTVVVPCYNEADRLEADAFEAFARETPDCRLLFVNDGSTDSTQSQLESLQSSQPDQFAVLTLDQNRGKAEAVRLGLLEAMRASPTYVGFWDADLATPLDAIPVFQNILDQRPHLHLAVGSRVKLLGRKIDRTPFRHYAGRFFATCASLVLKIPIYDTQCGAKIFRVTPIAKKVFAEPFTTTWIFDVECMARYGEMVSDLSLEQIIYEIPLPQWKDVAGSKLKSGDFLKAAFELNKIRRTYRLGRKQHASERSFFPIFGKRWLRKAS